MYSGMRSSDESLFICGPSQQLSDEVSAVSVFPDAFSPETISFIALISLIYTLLAQRQFLRIHGRPLQGG